MSVLLEVTGLHAFYGKSHVLRGVDLCVDAGEVVTLCGRNGAGRSTALKAIMGQVRARGSIRFRGEEIAGLSSYLIARKGVGYVAESRDVFPELSVEQNLILGEKKGNASRWSTQDMYRMFPLLGERQHTPTGVLSGGEQQMLALCRALMGDPAFIMIDEPTEGLAPAMVDAVAACLRTLKESGVAILLVEQKMSIALALSHRVCVLGHGAIVFEGTPENLCNAPAITREWLAVR